MSKCSSVALYILSWLRARPVLMTAALLLAGALSVHELRYLVAFGDEAEDALAHHGHGFLTFLTPLLVTLAAIGMAAHWFARPPRRPGALDRRFRSAASGSPRQRRC